MTTAEHLAAAIANLEEQAKELPNEEWRVGMTLATEYLRGYFRQELATVRS